MRRRTFKPAEAQATDTCILAAPATCGSPVYDSIRSALNAACPDPTANADCDAIVTACAATTPTTAGECHGLIDGMTAAGRQSVMDCAVTSGCTFGLWSCVEGL